MRAYIIASAYYLASALWFLAALRTRARPRLTLNLMRVLGWLSVVIGVLRAGMAVQQILVARVPENFLWLLAGVNFLAAGVTFLLATRRLQTS